MRNLIVALALLFSSSLTAGTFFCYAPEYDADTRFDGEVGVPDAQGLLLYFGPNPADAEVEGVYKFESARRMKLFFTGEPTHICDLFRPGDWNCRMGKWFRYRLKCDF